MRILYAAAIRLPTEKAHGAQIVRTCEALARRGLEVELAVPGRATATGSDPFAYYGAARNFTISTLRAPDLFASGRLGFLLGSALFARRVARRARETGADLVYSRDKQVLLALRLLAPRLRLVWEVHGREPAWLARRASRIVAISQGIKDDLAARGVAEERILVAHDGVDPRPFAHAQSKEAARTRLGLPQDKKIAMYVGRLDGWKGSETFCKAAALLPEGTLAVLIGGEPAQVDALRVKYPSALLLGSRPYAEVADNEAAADVLVLPNTARDETSARFTSPLKLFTYLAAGKPVVASDLPSLREVVSEREVFFVVPDDARALADGIALALTSHEAAARAAAALALAPAYTWDARAARIAEFLAP